MIDAEIPEPTRVDGHNRGAIAEAGGLYGFLLGLHEAHGGIARFWLDPETPIVSIADPARVAETLRIGDRPVNLFRFLEPLLGARNLQVLSAPEAREHRKLMIPTLGHERVLRDSFESLVLKTAGLRERWAAAADAGEVISLQKDLTELSFDMIGTVAFGSTFESEALGARMTSSFNDVLHEFLHQQYGLPSELSEEERRSRWTRALAYVKETTQAAIAARAGARERSGERSDLLDVLLEKGLPAEEIEMVVLSTLLAGFHTSGIGVSWTLYLLAQHPTVEAKLRAELDALLGTRLAPTYEELGHLSYLEMVLNESMRRYPPAPFAARETPEEITLGGFKIPARTTILYPICCVHRDRRYWPDPDVFDPERFCEAVAASRPHLAFMPFGVGQRSCSGMKLALLEMKLMLAMLVKTLSVRPVPGHPVVPVERFVLWSQDDIRATVARR